MKGSSTLGGLAGAVTLTLLNEGVSKIDKNSPRPDLLGQNALAKLMKGNGIIPKTAEKFFPLAGDLVTNSLFFGMAKGSSPGNTLFRGALLGLTAGIGALILPKHLGMPEEHTNKNKQRAIMTVGWYILGGLVAAAVINMMDKKEHPSAHRELTQGIKSAGREITRTVNKNSK